MSISYVSSSDRHYLLSIDGVNHMSKVDELVAMGFTAEDATVALNICDQDSQRAVMYLLEGPSSGAVDVTNGNKVDQMPQLPQRAPPGYSETAASPSNAVAIPELGPEITAHIEEYNPISSSTGEQIKEYNPNANKYNIFEDIPRTRRRDDPFVIFPSAPNMFDSYLPPLITLLNNVPLLRNTLLKHQYFSYPYTKNWWNRSKDNNPFPMELQKLLAMFGPESHRAFASCFNLNNQLNKLLTEEIETGSLFDNFILNQIYSSFGKINPDLCKPLKTLLQWSFLNKESYYVIPIEDSNLSNKLYDNIHNTLWGVDLENFHNNKLETINDVTTICIDSNGNSINDGLDLLEEIYPQIYTKQFEHVIGGYLSQVEDIKEKYHSNNNAMQSSRIFQGKKVDNILNMASEYLRDTGKTEGINPIEGESLSESDKLLAAGQYIESIKAHLEAKRQYLEQETNSLPDKVSTLKRLIYNPQEIALEHRLEPWVITGVIVSPNEYFYRNNNDDDRWTHIQIDPETCKDFEVEMVDFEYVYNEVRATTRVDFDQTMVMMYVRQSVWEKKEIDPLNSNLAAFVEEDNIALAELIAADENGLLSSSRDADNLEPEQSPEPGPEPEMAPRIPDF